MEDLTRAQLRQYRSHLVYSWGLMERMFRLSYAGSSKGKSFYFITFIDQEAIDKLAPLEISPSPDTLIRVLMDFKPLEKPIVVPPLELQAVPQREGFTVVEWGGLRQ